MVTTSIEQATEPINTAALMNPDTSIRGRSRAIYRGISSPLRLWPDFIIIGAERCGTTSLYRYLIDHPQVGQATMKEVHFFDYRFQKGSGWYHAQFPLALHKRIGKQPYITGEATPNYLFYPYAAKRVAKLLPRAKLIVLLRDPVERAFSQYCLKVGQGREKASFEEAIALEEERTQAEWHKIMTDEQYVSYSYWYHNYAYLARGIYADQLETWLRYFPQEQLLIIKSEDFYADTAGCFKQTLSFLGLPDTGQSLEKTEYKQYNQPRFTPPKKMSAEVRAHLAAYYAPHNARLSALLGRDFHWE